jgi:sugar phosphate isomerase/epimerase
MSTPAPTYGVDLITFYHPSFWGVGTYDDIMEIRRRDPLAIWTRILDALTEAGISAFEMTFPPADATSAVEAFGSAAGFRRELDSRGLSLISSYHSGSGWRAGSDLAAEVDRAQELAQFVADVGGGMLVAGLPMRTSRDSVPPLFVDLAFADTVASFAHAVGDATLRVGVKTALHTEAHSTFCTRRDIDLILTATDPEYVFFCPDTAHITLAGGDAVEVVRRHADRVIIAHWKDAVGRMPEGFSIDHAIIHDQHQEYMCALGTGVVDWPAWARLYDSTAGAPWRLLELDAVPSPIDAMRAAKAFIVDSRL